MGVKQEGVGKMCDF